MSEPAIEAVGLTKHYGRTVGLHGLDLRIERGECFGFLGSNGAGKTTAIRLALGLLRPTGGRVAIMGHDLASDRIGALAHVGYLPGEIGLVREISGERLLDVLARLHPRPPTAREELLARLELRPEALNRRVREYSRGMKQKLALVGALQHDPPVIVLDEPTGGLDPVMQSRVLEWLAERTRLGRTVFLSSHALTEVEDLCDRVAMVRRGRLLTVETVAELRGQRVRAVTVRFAGAIEPTEYAVAGVGAPQISAQTHRFVLRGEPGPLLAALGRLPVVDISVEAPRLEDVFLARYGEEPGA